MKPTNNFSNQEPFVFENEGILSSVYKEEINRNFFQSRASSIFGIKQKIKSKRYSSEILLTAVLKFVICLILVVTMLNI